MACGFVAFLVPRVIQRQIHKPVHVLDLRMFTRYMKIRDAFEFLLQVFDLHIERLEMFCLEPINAGELTRHEFAV